MPLFSDVLKNTNSNAPSLDLNDLQVRGVGVFADKAARDLLDATIQTEGYLAIMKDSDTPFIYTGGTWTDAANWSEVKGAWEEVAYTNDTAIKYENGVVGLKKSSVTYPTSGNLWGKIKNFPVDRDQSGGAAYKTDVLMHLHEGKILFTTENTSTNYDALIITNAQHSAAYSMSIGMESNFGTISGQSGIRMKPSGVSIMEFGYTGSGSTVRQIAVSNNLPVQGASTNKMGINMGESVLMLSGEILFYGHSANVFSAIKPRGFYSTNSGVSIASPRSGYFAHFAASDGNTVGSYGYLGINVDNPTPTGPAFEVSSSYGKFNSGLHVEGYITTNSWALNVTGDARIFTGSGASSSVRIGSGFGGSNTSKSVYMGYNVGSGTGQANNNVVIGTDAAGGTGAYYESVIIGSGALAANTEGTRTSVLIGYSAGGGGLNGYSPVGVGFRALMSSTGAHNVGIGQRGGMMAGGNCTFVGNASGGFSAAATGSNNVGIGAEALSYVEGSNNTAVGTNAGIDLTTGTYNVLIGRSAGGQLTTESNRLYIDNSNTSTPLIYGEFDNDLLRVNGSLYVEQEHVYKQKYKSVATAHIGDNTQTETSTVSYVERYYTAKKDGDAVDSTEYTGAGTRRLFFAPKYNADPTKIETQDNPEGWIMVNTGTEWTPETGEFQALNSTIKQNYALDETTNTEANYETLLNQYTGHKNYQADSVTFAVVVIPTVLTVNSGSGSSYQIFTSVYNSFLGTNTSYVAAGTTIDWGDGNVDTIASDILGGVGTDLTHTYASADTDYTITINGFIRGVYFYNDQQLKAIDMGTQVRLGHTNGIIDVCYNLSSLLGRIFFRGTYPSSVVNVTPPTFLDCVRLNAINMEHWYDPYQYMEPDVTNSHTWGTQAFKNVTSNFNPNVKAYIKAIQEFNTMDSHTATMDFTNGSAVATKATAHDYKVVEGRKLIVDGQYYTIQSIDSDTQLTLTSNFTGTTGSYTIELDLRSSNFTSWSNMKTDTYEGSTGINPDIDSFRDIENVWLRPAYLAAGADRSAAPIYPPGPIEKAFANDETKYICDDMVRCTNGSTTLQAESSWINLTIPTRVTQSVDVTNNSKVVTATTGDLIYQFLKDYMVEIDGSLYEVDDLTSATTLTLTANFTGTTGTYTATPMVTPPVHIDGKEYIVRSIDTGNNTLELCTSFTGTTGNYKIESLGWRIGNGGGFIQSIFSHIQDPNVIIKNVDFSNIGTGANNYQRVNVFKDGSIINPDISGWKFARTGRQVQGNNTHQGLGMDATQMFYRCYDFNTNSLADWDVQGIANFSSMFESAYKFNGDISGWNTASAVWFTDMFKNAYKFNSDIGSWDTSNVRTMHGMFEQAYSFSQDISGWDTSNVRDMSDMFYFAGNFDQPIGSWDVSSVTTMSGMFKGSIYGNPNNPTPNMDLNEWDTSNVTDMSYMFEGAERYNPAIDQWDTSSVTNFKKMFASRHGRVLTFDQDLSGWDVTSVTTFSGMFTSMSSISSQNLANSVNAWQVGLTTTNISSMFSSSSNLYLCDLSGWNTTNITNMYATFSAKGGGENLRLDTWNTSSLAGSMATFMRNGNSGLLPGEAFINCSGYTGSSDQLTFGSAVPDNWTVGADLHFRTGGYQRGATKITAISVDRLTVTVENKANDMWSTNAVTGAGLGYRSNPDVSGWDMSRITTLTYAFENCDFNQDLSSWNLNVLTGTHTNTFVRATYSAVSKMWIGWSANANTATGNTMSFGSKTFSLAATTSTHDYDGEDTYGGYLKMVAPTPATNRTSGTNTSTTTNKLVDSGATFTASVGVGDVVENTTAGTFAKVNSVDSDTELTLNRDIFTTTSQAYSIDGGIGWVIGSITFS